MNRIKKIAARKNKWPIDLKLNVKSEENDGTERIEGNYIEGKK